MSGIRVNDPVPRNAAVEATGAASLTSGYALGTAWADSFHYNPILDGAFRHQEQIEAAAGTAMPETGPVVPEGDWLTPPRNAPAPMSQKDANEIYGIPGELSFPGPTRKAEAELLARWKLDEIKRRNVLSRATPGVLPTMARLGVSFLANAVDPLNIASAFLPVVGEARFAALATRLGRPGARLVTGATEGLVGAAVIEPIVLMQAQNRQADYDAYDSLLNLAFGTALGGGLHVGFGALSDFIGRQPIEVRETALRGALAAVAEDRPVAVAEGITAFHGSPHTFDKFSVASIGTGQGADSFGHGLYFAEKRDVAESYKIELAKDGGGNLYEVRINATKADLLDLDEPLSHQSSKVQAAIREFYKNDSILKNNDPTGARIYEDLTFSQGKAPRKDWERLASEHLRALGIPGIKYLDQGSRNAGGWKITPPDRTTSGDWMVKSSDYNSKGMHFKTEAEAQAALAEKIGGDTRNFVIFDDSLIDIVKRNDQPFDQRAMATAQAKSNELQPIDRAQAAEITRLSEGYDQPITPDTAAEEAADLIAATNEAHQMAKRDGVLTDADEAAIKGDPEAEKAAKEVAAGRDALVACLVRAA